MTTITIDKLQIPVTFSTTRNKGKNNEVTFETSTTLDFSDYSAEDIMNRVVDSVVIAIQSSLRNPPKDASKGIKTSDLEGKVYKPAKPGRSASRVAPEDAMFTYYKKCTLAQRATLPKQVQEVFEAMIDAENQEAIDAAELAELARLEREIELANAE